MRHIIKPSAPVTVNMEPQEVADIVGVPLEDIYGYGNGYAAIYAEAIPSSNPVSPMEGVDVQDGEEPAPKPKPRAKRKKSVKANG